MLAYNLNCWLQLFNREPGASVETMRHTTLATARLRKSNRGPVDSYPSLPRRSAPEAASIMAHRILCTWRTIDTTSSPAALRKSEEGGKQKQKQPAHHVNSPGQLIPVCSNRA
jgi:hypothetical protein